MIFLSVFNTKFVVKCPAKILKIENESMLKINFEQGFCIGKGVI